MWLETCGVCPCNIRYLRAKQTLETFQFSVKKSKTGMSSCAFYVKSNERDTTPSTTIEKVCDPIVLFKVHSGDLWHRLHRMHPG